MIEKFSNNEKELYYDIIPRLKGWNEISLKPGDTLIVYWDYQVYDMETAKKFYKMVEKVFPNNQILFMPIEAKLGVVKDESMGTF